MSNRNDSAPHADNIDLDIINTGVHLEHIDQFDNSFFRSVYKKAFLQLNDIINRNFQSNNHYQRGSNYKDYYLAVRSKSGEKYESCPNIITFAGRRGSGKTSAMLSFMEALKDYYRYIKSTKNKSFYTFQDMDDKKMDDILFTCLDCIDGSLLEHGEDIFKIVLAQMYQKFIDLDQEDLISKGYNFDMHKRELLQQLEDIYKTVCEVEDQEKRQTAPGESYMSSLRSLSSSQKVKRDFEKLICDFTALMKYVQNGVLQESKQHYVVIAIDDIDLNISNGFFMLEKIHRYCMVPNVIVLLSVDIDQMLSIVFKNFFKVLPEVDELLVKGEGRVHKLSMDYLDKVMPVNYRVHIPELNDFLSSHYLSMGKEHADIKKSILRKIYRRVGICFDSQSAKRHFYEPKSMRQLTCFYLMLESMGYVWMESVYFGKKLLPEERSEIVKIWEDNYWPLIEDLSNRTVFDKLYDDEDVTELCEAIRKENISFAKNRVIDFFMKVEEDEENRESNKQIAKDIKNKKTETRKRKEKNKKRETNQKDYDYGTLLETIYQLRHWGNEKYEPLVQYLLGYFSYAFTREYLYEKLEIKSYDKVLVEAGQFKEFAGTIISKEWSNALLPNASERKDEDTGIGEAEHENWFQSSFLDYADLKEVLMAPVFSIELKTKEEFVHSKAPDYVGMYQYIAETIRDLEVLFLFFNGFKQDKQDKKVGINTKDVNWKCSLLEQKISERKKLNLKPEVKGQPDISILGSYNVLNFVGNSMDAVDILEKFEENLICCLAEEYPLYDEDGKQCDRAADENHDGEARKFNEIFEEKLESYSIKSKYLKWEEKFGSKSLPLPIYWFDFTYNILKRTMRSLAKEITVSAELENMFSFIRKVYKDIESRLGEQQDYYSWKSGNKPEKEGPDPDDYQLQGRFSECPVVEYFFEEDERKKKFIGDVMLKLQKYRKKINIR